MIEYIDYPYTSNDVGYRKTSTRGLLLFNRDGKAVDSVCNKSITSLVELIEFVTIQPRSKHLLLRS